MLQSRWGPCSRCSHTDLVSKCSSNVNFSSWVLTFWERVYFLSQHIDPASIGIIPISWEVPAAPSCRGRGTEFSSSPQPSLCRTRGDVADGLLGVILSLQMGLFAARKAGVAAFKMTAGDRERHLRLMCSVSLCWTLMDELSQTRCLICWEKSLLPFSASKRSVNFVFWAITNCPGMKNPESPSLSRLGVAF